MTAQTDIYPDGTIVHRRMTLMGVNVDIAYVKSRGEWYATAGHPASWEELQRLPSYASTNQYRVRLPKIRHNLDLWRET